MKNLPTLAQVAADPDILSDLPLETLDAIASTADEAKKTADTVKKVVTGLIEDRLAPGIAAAFAAKESDTGTVHLTRDGFDIEVNRPKKVEWSQPILAEIVAKIAAAGDRPEQYVKTTYAVEERSFTAWPDYLRDQFAPARTVKAGSATIKLSAAKSEAA